MDDLFVAFKARVIMKVGICGKGFVGGALFDYLKSVHKDIEITCYDIDPDKKDCTQKIADLHDSDIVFVCVPTPTINGNQEKESLIDVLTALSRIELKDGTPIIIRSTILPGTTEAFSISFPELNISNMPEFLREACALQDMKDQPSIILGFTKPNPDNRAKTINAIYNLFPEKTLRTDDSIEVEMAKYIHNLFLATKVTFFNEIYEACLRNSISFESAVALADIAGKKIGLSHTTVPGPDGLFGFGGHCFPKDMASFIKKFSSHYSPLFMLKAAYAGNLLRRDDLSTHILDPNEMK